MTRLISKDAAAPVLGAILAVDSGVVVGLRADVAQRSCDARRGRFLAAHPPPLARAADRRGCDDRIVCATVTRRSLVRLGPFFVAELGRRGADGGQHQGRVQRRDVLPAAPVAVPDTATQRGRYEEIAGGVR